MNIGLLKQMLEKGDSVLVQYRLFTKEEDGTLREFMITKDKGYIDSGTVEDHVPSNPPSGHFKVTNLYVDAATGKLVVEWDDTPAP